tara:strand:+ start:2347 stop:3624 length:1278 start_codon:yes stop_codon:yes gene_type:complete
MGKGKQAPADSTVRQTNLPEYADPYFRRLLQGAEEASMPFDPVTGQSTYVPYQGERLAPSSMYGDIQASRAMTRGIAQSGIPGMQQAMGAQRAGMAAQQEGMDVTRRGIGYTEQGIGNLREIGQYDTGRFDPYSNFRMANYNQFGFQQPERFSGIAAAQYMSPYMDAVVDEQKRGAIQDFQRQQAGRDAAAVQAGAFGGSRQAVGDYLAEEGLMDTLGGIEATGRQQAFQQAAQQFGLDRAARMEAERSQAAELARVQAGRAGEMGRVQGAEASELARIQQALEQSRQFGAGQALAAEQAALQGAGQLNTFAQGLGGLGMNVGQLGQSLAGLGERQRAADIQGAQLLESVGRDIRAEDQGRLDLAYEDFQRQRDYPMQQYERFAGLLRGIPVTPNIEQQRMVNYNPIQQALGAGISALGLYKGLA